MTTIIAAGFIAHDGECIYGIGATPDAARENAREWLDGGDPAALTVQRATADLMLQVENIGGDEAWATVGSGSDAICCTKAEAEAAA